MRRKTGGAPCGRIRPRFAAGVMQTRREAGEEPFILGKIEPGAAHARFR